MTESNGDSLATVDESPSADSLWRDLDTLQDGIKNPPETVAELRERCEAAVSHTQ